MSPIIAIRRFPFLPQFIEGGNGERRKAHWLGNRPPETSQQRQSQRGPASQPPKPSETRAYRDLASITLGEVRHVFQFFEQQLIASPYPGWIGTNMFCIFDLKQREDEYRPAAIFGRVQTSYPSDGEIHNIRTLELLFPRPDGAPDVVLLKNHEVETTQPVQSYGLRVKVLASSDELADFSSAENEFLAQGLIPDYSDGYIDLLNLREPDRDSYPWFYVVGSRWLGSIPDSVKPEIRESLKRLLAWNKQVFNYHPRRLEPEIRTLNWELEFSYGFTERFLITPESPADAVKILASTFNRLFQQPIK